MTWPPHRPVCCGVEVLTPCCPYCGKRTVGSHRLSGLLAYVRQRVKERNRYVAKVEAYSGEGAVDRQSRLLPQARRKAAEWTGYEEELARVIAAEIGGEK